MKFSFCFNITGVSHLISQTDTFRCFDFSSSLYIQLYNNYMKHFTFDLSKLHDYNYLLNVYIHAKDMVYEDIVTTLINSTYEKKWI